MPSLVDIFNPSFFIFLGILVLVAALLVVYFESKMREQNHKMASMLNLVTCMADEMNAIKVHLVNQPNINEFIPSSLETNNVHIIKTDLIAVSDDESDNDSENSIEDNETDSESDSGSESNSGDIEDIKEVIELGEHNDIKVLKLNISNINDVNNIADIDENNLDDLDDLCGEDICISDDSISVSSDDEDCEKNDDEIDISKLDFKSINISSLEEVKHSDIVDYKKFTLNKLRSIVVEKELVSDSSKLKKPELLKLLGVE